VLRYLPACGLENFTGIPLGASQVCQKEECIKVIVEKVPRPDASEIASHHAKIPST